MRPLHQAALSGSYDLARLLLAEGADPNATLSNDKTVLHVLYSPSACTSCDGKAQQETSRREIATHIVQAGVSPDAQDTAGASALHYASMGADAQEATTELVQLGADPKVRDQEGVPVWFYASLAGNTATAESVRLAALGAVEAVDLGGRNQEEWALAKRMEMDSWRDSFKPETITGLAASGPSGIRHSGCHYWLGAACTVLGGAGCTFLCIAASGPWAWLCPVLCGLMYYFECYTAVELACGPG